MDKGKREKLVLLFRTKAEEAFLAAPEDYANGRYRAACNRAWYSVYHLVTAAAYLKLKQEPPSERDSWNHNAVKSMLNHLLRASHVRLRYGILIDCLPSLREIRLVADYLEEDGRSVKTDAENAIIVAERVRRVVREIMGW